ncbi:MAG: carboxypeptidase regulatory-like domain-containing protein [Blastocatellia bacterium]
MKTRTSGLMGAVMVLIVCGLTAVAQTTSPISGTVMDQNGAVVSGATVTVKNNATGSEFRATTASNGVYTVPAISAGQYTLTIEARGFKKAVVQDAQVLAATPATVNVTLEIGAATDSVVIQGGAEILQTQSATVSTTITGRQITELPFTSRDALDLVLLLPGTNTPGRPRTSTINGLPKGSLNITIDGINVQDNILKSSDGFFTYVRPRIDAIDEVTVSTSNPGAESSAEGAVQIKFVTRSGTNEFHGSIYEYHRNPALNANYWFNNRDLARDATGRAPRDRVLINQYGFRLGGPIWLPKKLFGPASIDGRDRAFFFVNYEEFRIPEAASRQRTILSEAARTGTFRYNATGGVRSVNLYQLAAANGQVSTPDPIIGQLLLDIRNSTSPGAINPLTDPNLELFSFQNRGGQSRFFPTVRFDFNLTSKHKLENTWNYQKFDGVVDFLNATDPAFPNFPNQGFQGSNRFSNSLALRSTLTSSIVNEARFGLTGGTVLFFPNVNRGQFTGTLANQAGFNIGIGAAGISSATVSTTPSRRNAPVWQFSDTLSWTRGAHSINIGGSFSQINFWSWSQAQVPGITLGLDTNDPAVAMFSAANFPGAAAADITRAQAIYATLTGRVTAISASAVLNEKTKQYSYLGENVQRGRQREFGVFGSDTWRVNNNLTLNYGVRWEVQRPFVPLNDLYAQTSFDQLFGVSGTGNIFRPGATGGSATQYTSLGIGESTFNTDFNNFAPSFGFAWSPNAKGSFLRKLTGEGGQTVFRGGYSVAYNREGLNVFTSIYASNPGITIDASRNLVLNNLVPTPISGNLPLLFRDQAKLGQPQFQNAPSFPNQFLITNSANALNPDLRLGYVQSWSFGVQREINRDTVFEARYVGNRGVKQWQQYNLNEVNLVENGFINEFKLAQANLQANIAAGRGANFRYAGPNTGTAPLPIMLGFLTGQAATAAGTAGNYANALFANATFVNALALNNPAPGTFAGFGTGLGNFISNATFRNNGITAGMPANFFLVNPGKLGGAWTIENNGRTAYDSLQVELRRRLSKGLLVQGNYTYARAFSNAFASSSAVVGQPRTLRNMRLDKTVSPFNVEHAFKVNWIYELPFGKGQWLGGNAGAILDRVVGGWGFHGAARLQSGTPFDFGNVSLVGMTRTELQKVVKMRFNDASRIAYYLPQDIIDNTIRAHNVSATSADGYGALGAPTGKYIAPASGRNCVEAFVAQCGTSHLVLFGPRFSRYDLSIVKKTRITETVNFEFRAEFLNAFNNINFMVGNPANDTNTIGGFGAQTFGQVTQAYRDLSTTNDPGGRMIQFVGRINF